MIPPSPLSVSNVDVVLFVHADAALAGTEHGRPLERVVAFERVLDARLGRGRERRRVGVLHRGDGRVPHLLAGEQRRLERSVVVVGAADGAQLVDWIRSWDPRDFASVPLRRGVSARPRRGAGGARHPLRARSVGCVFVGGQEWVLVVPVSCGCLRMGEGASEYP